MNLLNKLTLKSLKLNKKRTIVTIIGIILSTALIVAVSSLVTSARVSLIEYEKKKKEITIMYFIMFLKKI